MFDKFPAPDFPKWAKVAINQIVNWPSLPSGNPTNSRHPATKGYVDAQIAAIPLPVFTKSFTSTDQTITAAGALTLAHGLGVAPGLVRFSWICQSADLGYSTGDEVDVVYISNLGVNGGLSATCDATNINIRFGSTSTVLGLPHKTTGAVSSVSSASNWKLRVRAYA